jgi:hypothetical protein
VNLHNLQNLHFTSKFRQIGKHTLMVRNHQATIKQPSGTTQKGASNRGSIKPTRLHYIIKRHREKLALVKMLPAIG